VIQFRLPTSDFRLPISGCTVPQSTRQCKASPTFRATIAPQGTMKKQAREVERRRRRPSSPARILRWTLGLALVALAVYGISQYSGVPWDEEDIRVVDFSSLTPAAKRTALRRANSARCTCGCGMNMAQCVATDSTCPIRDKNIDAIRTMVREAGSAEGGI
jgi:hypothetical protein